MLFKNVTLYQEGRILKNRFVRIKGQTIDSITESEPILDEGEIIKDAKGHIMLPGFANTHSHIPMTLMRGYGEGLPLQQWLFEKMFPFEDRLTPEDCYWGTSLGLLEMISSGTVSYSDMYYNVDEITQATVDAGLKANIGRGITSNGSGSFAEHIARVDMEALDQKVQDHGWDRLIKVDSTIHGEYTSDEKLVREVAEYTKATGRILQVHVSETRLEHQACIEKHGMTPTEYFSQCGLFDGPVIAAHCVHVSDRDIDILKKHDVTVAHCISSNMKLGSGIAPLKKFIDRGLRVALGTDGAASNNNLNFLEEIHLVAMVHKAFEQDSLFLSPVDLLQMASKNGFMAQGRPESGVLKEGAAADLILISLESPHMTPSFDILSNLIYSAQSSDVRLTMVNGKILYENGEYKTLDEEKIKYMSSQIQKRILGELAELKNKKGE